MQGLGTWATSSFVGGGFGVAWRAAGRERVALSLTAGSRDGALAGRGELLAAYYLSPTSLRGLSLYGAAGIAVQAVRNVAGGWSGPQGDLVLVAGIESRPGAGSGWFVEGGVGGGVRMALGLRWRHRRG